MIHLDLTGGADEAAAIARAVEILRRDGVVAYPTDTLYGLAVDPRSSAAVGKLFEVKGRDARAAMPLIAASLEQAQEVGTLGDVERRLAAAFWPGPLTIVVPASPRLTPGVLGGGHTVAVRVPANALARALAAAFGFAVTATSANRSGAPATADAREVSSGLGDRIDVLLDGGDAPGGPPSTIVRVDRGGLTLVRAGAIAWERVLESLQ